jgi:hypothetical protein
MYRNDALIPFWALVIALVLGWAAYLDSGRVAILSSGRGPAVLSVGQIGLVAFGLVFAVYGMIGLVSVWLEGVELRPGRHTPKPGGGPVVVGVLLALLLAAASGLFVHDILESLQTLQVHPASEGMIFGVMALLSAALIVVYRKYVVGEEAIAEDEHSEVPW